MWPASDGRAGGHAKPPPAKTAFVEGCQRPSLALTVQPRPPRASSSPRRPVVAGVHRPPPAVAFAIAKTQRVALFVAARDGALAPALPFLSVPRWLSFNFIWFVLFFLYGFFLSDFSFYYWKLSNLFSKINEPNIPTCVRSYFCNPEFAGFLKIRRFSHSL